MFKVINYNTHDDKKIEIVSWYDSWYDDILHWFLIIIGLIVGLFGFIFLMPFLWIYWRATGQWAPIQDRSSWNYVDDVEDLF